MASASERPLRPGDVIDVKSSAEILATLDGDGALDGPPLIPEMIRHVGRWYAASRRVDKICDTIAASGSRRMHDTVYLEDRRCHGSEHAGCQAGVWIASSTTRQAACSTSPRTAWSSRTLLTRASAAPVAGSVRARLSILARGLGAPGRGVRASANSARRSAVYRLSTRWRTSDARACAVPATSLTQKRRSARRQRRSCASVRSADTASAYSSRYRRRADVRSRSP
jgi:hypothetical protein